MTGMDWFTLAALAFVAYTFGTITTDIPPFAVAAIWALWGAVTSGVAINLWDKHRGRKATKVKDSKESPDQTETDGPGDTE